MLFLKTFIFIYLFLAVSGLRCCVGCSLVVATGGYSPAAVHELLIAVAFLIAELQALEQAGFSGRGS